jgi:hypothetical protein
LNEANKEIKSKNYSEAMGMLKAQQKAKNTPLNAAYLQQMKAWLCKCRVENFGFRGSADREALLTQGLDFVVSGINRITGFNLNREQLLQFVIEPESFNMAQRKCLASLLSTGRHLLNLKGELGNARKVLGPRHKPLFQQADALNPDRLKKRLTRTRQDTPKIKVVDAATFELMRAAL